MSCLFPSFPLFCQGCHTHVYNQTREKNVKLVQSLRQKVKAKAKTVFESGSDRGKEANRKNVVYKVGCTRILFRTMLTGCCQAIFDELVTLVDPGVEPYKPKKGHSNVIMAVGLQVSFEHPYVIAQINRRWLY